METNTINVTLFNQVASKRHLNLNQLLTNAFSVELNEIKNPLCQIKQSKVGKNKICSMKI